MLKRWLEDPARVRWLCLAALILVMPLFVRGNGSLPQAASPTQTQTPPPDAPQTLPPAATDAAPPEDAPIIAEDIAGIVFVDATGAGDTGVEGTAGPDAAHFGSQTVSEATSPGTAGTSAASTSGNLRDDKRGVWTYESDRIAVRVERHKQDDFVYFAADVRISEPDQLSYAFSNEQYGARTEALSDMAERHDPVIAMNGDYYSFHDNGIIIRGGELFRKKNSARHLLAVEANGDLTVLTDRREKQGVVADEMMARGVLHTFEFGPVLVEGGEKVRLNSAIVRDGEGYLEPRTAIGQFGPLHYLVIVVDGRSEGYSAGCDLPTLQQLFLEYGVETAFNLDGGGSTTLWFDGEVISRPSSGDERKVSDIVMFMR